MKGYIVTYKDHGEEFSSQLVHRFDSLNELSAKTIALKLLDDGKENVVICEVDCKPLYRIEAQERYTMTKIEP